MKIEIWKDVLGYEGLYKVSNMGRVKSLNYRRSGKEKMMTLHNNGKDYQFVALTKDKKIKYFYVHRIVWEAFNGPIPNGMVINHKSEIKSQNNIENLECITQKDNCNYGSRNKIISGLKKGKETWNKGIPTPISVREKISNAKKGTIPWNKGISGSKKIREVFGK